MFFSGCQPCSYSSSSCWRKLMWLSGLTARERRFPMSVLFQWSILLYTSVSLVGQFPPPIINFSPGKRKESCRVDLSLWEVKFPCSCIFPVPGPPKVPVSWMPGALLFYNFLFSPVLPMWLLYRTRYMCSSSGWLNPALLSSLVIAQGQVDSGMCSQSCFFFKEICGCYCVPLI